MSLRRIVYTSRAEEKMSKRKLLDLLHDSRAFNTIDNISGVLMHRNEIFLQVIEGESQVLHELFERLSKDTRHKEIKIISDELVTERLFSSWAMGCADFDDPELSLLPGVRPDFSDPKVIDDLIKNLPEIASFLLETIE